MSPHYIQRRAKMKGEMGIKGGDRLDLVAGVEAVVRYVTTKCIESFRNGFEQGAASGA